jgi:hypothetical protein
MGYNELKYKSAIEIPLRGIPTIKLIHMFITMINRKILESD